MICVPIVAGSMVRVRRSFIILRQRTILTNRYEIGMAIGFGGFGVIYHAWDVELGTQVAVKEYYPNGLVNRVPGQANVVVYSGSRA